MKTLQLESIDMTYSVFLGLSVIRSNSTMNLWSTLYYTCLLYTSKHTHKAQNKFDLPGVYKLNCSNCNKFYIGQTGRCFKQRYIEHTKGLHSTTESTFANHLIEPNHTYTNINSNMDILHIHTKGQKLDTLKQLEIYKHIKTTS